MYTINLIQNTQIIKTFEPKTKAEAKRIFQKHTETDAYYTQLVIANQPKTLAQGERIFGKRDYNVQPICAKRK